MTSINNDKNINNDESINKLFTKSNYNKYISNTDFILNDLYKLKQNINNNFNHFCMPNVLSNTLCDLIINESEKYANINNGWYVDRHRNYPTTDIPIRLIPSLSNLILNVVTYDIFPIIAYRYNISKYFLNCIDLFIVKYHENFQTKLERHVDGSIFSFNILLNDPCDFEGGGTNLEENGNDILVLNSKGGLLIHSGKCYHSGKEITKGVRYVLVGFINYINHYPLKNETIRKPKLNIDSLYIKSQYLKNIYDNINSSSISYILNTDKELFNIVEKLIYTLALFHIKKLGKTFDSKKFYIEFWWKNDVVNDNIIVHDFHIDKDENALKKYQKLFVPILSTVTYLNDSKCPTIIYNGEIRNKENIKDNDLIISLPRELKHISFDGLNPHGAFKIFDNIENTTRKTLMFNLWENHCPENVMVAEKHIFPENINNFLYTKEEDIFELNDNNNIKNITTKPNFIIDIIKNILQNKMDPKTITEITKLLNLNGNIDCDIFKLTI